MRIEALASALGVSKGGFYWQFANRDALIEQMLDTWEKVVVDDVIDLVEQDADPQAQLRRLFDVAMTSDSGELAAELAIRDWSRTDDRVAARLHRVDDRRMSYLRILFRRLCDDDTEAEARGLLAFSLFVGNHFIRARHLDRTRAEVLRDALAYLSRR